MKNNEEGVTLVEILAALVLLSLVTGIIWTAASTALRVNVASEANLRVQQEANYIIAELQRIHRACDSYKLTISEDVIKTEECTHEKKGAIAANNRIISSDFKYAPLISGELILPKEKEYPITGLTVTSKRFQESDKKTGKITIDTVLTRYVTDDENGYPMPN